MRPAPLFSSIWQTIVPFKFRDFDIFSAAARSLNTDTPRAIHSDTLKFRVGFSARCDLKSSSVGGLFLTRRKTMRGSVMSSDSSGGQSSGSGSRYVITARKSMQVYSNPTLQSASKVILIPHRRQRLHDVSRAGLRLCPVKFLPANAQVPSDSMEHSRC